MSGGTVAVSASTQSYERGIHNNAGGTIVLLGGTIEAYYGVYNSFSGTISIGKSDSTCGTLNITKALIPNLKNGLIINVGSVHSTVARTNKIPYDMSKAAIKIFIVTLAFGDLRSAFRKRPSRRADGRGYMRCEAGSPNPRES